MRRKQNGTFVPRDRIKQISKICQICGKAFWVIPYRNNIAKYCSMKCYAKAKEKRIIGKCAFCGQIISIIPFRLVRNAKHFCSRRCKKEAEKTRPIKICPICSKEFKATLSGRKNGSQKRKIYCSRKCMAIGQSHKISLICKRCGKQFAVSPSSNKRRFCSPKCFQIYWKHEIKKQYRLGMRAESLIMNQFWTGKRTDLNNQFFRSSWEANFARFLNYFKINWVYEPQRFALSNDTTYLPDFHTPEFQCYFEVKGWFKNDEWKKKTYLFSRDHQLVIIDKYLYQSIERCFGNLIPNWEKYQWKKT